MPVLDKALDENIEITNQNDNELQDKTEVSDTQEQAIQDKVLDSPKSEPIVDVEPEAAKDTADKANKLDYSKQGSQLFEGEAEGGSALEYQRRVESGSLN